jgi:predicted transcriptional regulator
MYKYPSHRRITNAKLIKFVTVNPGMTANMIALCLRRNVGTVSSYLAKLAKAGLIARITEPGMRGLKGVYRYYPAQDAYERLRDAKEIIGEMLATVYINLKRGTLKSADDVFFRKIILSFKRRASEL